MTGYMVTNMAIFVVIIAWYNMTGKEEIDDFRGMRERAPLLAGVLAGALFSLAGLPLFAGFATKFILFQAVVDEGYYWLAAIGVVTSVVSLYYYLQVMKQAFVIKPAEGEEGSAPRPAPDERHGRRAHARRLLRRPLPPTTLRRNRQRHRLPLRLAALASGEDCPNDGGCIDEHDCAQKRRRLRYRAKRAACIVAGPARGTAAGK